MSRQRNRPNNRRGPYGRINGQSRSQHRDRDSRQDFAQGFVQNDALHQAQQQAQNRDNDQTEIVSDANSVPLGPRDRGFSLSRSAGNQVSRGAQTVETGNPLLFGPTSAVDDMNINPTRFAECRRQGMTVASLETTAKKGSIASSRRVPRDLFTTRKAPAKEVQQAQEVPQTAPSGPKCAGCGSRTHTLAWCFRCDDRGMMEGCPRCNTLSHGANNCGFNTNTREVISDVLYSRANMPPFSGRPWFLVFKDYIKGKENPPIPQAFPWRSEQRLPSCKQNWTLTGTAASCPWTPLLRTGNPVNLLLIGCWLTSLGFCLLSTLAQLSRCCDKHPLLQFVANQLDAYLFPWIIDLPVLCHVD
ncbi:hypothetical protein AUP68_02607 [Ilyonectria robusta]